MEPVAPIPEEQDDYKEPDRTVYPFVIDWPLHSGSETDDFNRFCWLENNVGDDNHFYDNGNPKYHDSVPRIFFKREEDLLAYRLMFTNRPYPFYPE